MEDTEQNTESNVSKQVGKYIDEWVTSKMRTLWMSFVDYDKPKGERFLGVVIINSLGPTHAMRETHQLGINPGGTIQFTEFESHKFAEEDFNILLSKKMLLERGLID